MISECVCLSVGECVGVWVDFKGAAFINFLFHSLHLHCVCVCVCACACACACVCACVRVCVVQGELVLNPQTKVSSLEDKGNRRNMFLVTCGATEKPFTISADDQKMKHDWMLAIRKVGGASGCGFL